jgi:hypothetical protein
MYHYASLATSVREAIFHLSPSIYVCEHMVNFNINCYLILCPHEKNSLLEACISSTKNAQRALW